MKISKTNMMFTLITLFIGLQSFSQEIAQLVSEADSQYYKQKLFATHNYVILKGDVSESDKLEDFRALDQEALVNSKINSQTSCTITQSSELDLEVMTCNTVITQINRAGTGESSETTLTYTFTLLDNVYELDKVVTISKGS